MAIDRIGKVQVLNTLGAGAHSSILHVRRADDGKQYALKVINVDAPEDKKYLEQAKHEFRVGQMLDHPSLIKVYCFETESDWLFRVKKAKLLTEFAPGQTLDKVPLLKIAKLLRVLEKVASGLVHMHRRGVFHGDLKPNNIMLGRGLSVKVIDYGLAKVKGDPAKDRVQGTPEYMAPETAMHKMVNERTDMFNFGGTMYRLVTFKLPPAIVTAGGAIVHDEKSYKEAFKPVNSLNPIAPKELCDLIHLCLQFNANRRPETMIDVHAVLDQLADKYAQQVDPSELEE